MFSFKIRQRKTNILFKAKPLYTDIQELTHYYFCAHHTASVPKKYKSTFDILEGNVTVLKLGTNNNSNGNNSKVSVGHFLDSIKSFTQ